MILGVIEQLKNGKVVAYDHFGNTLPDSILDAIPRTGMTPKRYEIEHRLAVDRANRQKGDPRGQPKLNRAKRRGYLYAVVCGNMIKLGRATHVHERMKEHLRIADGWQVDYLYVDDVVAGERELLSTFGGKPNRNEWLPYYPDLEARILTYFAELRARQAKQAA